MKRSSIALLGLVPPLASAQPQPGEWDFPFFFGPSQEHAIVAVHMCHVVDQGVGKFLVLTREIPGGCISGPSRLWTPPPIGSDPGDPGTFEPVPYCPTHLFCGGHSALADGRILQMGGGELTSINNEAQLFDPTIDPPPAGQPWNNPDNPPPMAYQRWYPTATTLGDGRVLVTSGQSTKGDPKAIPPIPPTFATTPELYYPPDWQPCQACANTFLQLPSADRLQELYPQMFLLPNGNLVDAGPGESRILHTASWTWGVSPIGQPGGAQPGVAGSAAMYEPGKIVRCGGGNPGRAKTWMIDLDPPGASPLWVAAGDMLGAHPGEDPGRRNVDLVVLPDGRLLAVGGNYFDDPESGESLQEVLAAEIFDPATMLWTLQPGLDPLHPRMYHSTAALLQDGRVVAAGGDDFRTAQIFNPPYITSPASRLEIVEAPAYMSYGQDYTIEYIRNGGAYATQACLIRLSSVTHSFDQDQRRVPLTIQESAGASMFVPLDQITVTAPANANIAPPGWYMLWILNEYWPGEYAPCELAAYVKVGP